jgi:kynurenine formamidase
MGPKWWPSEWGPDDQRGAMNRITPQKILQGVYNHENLDLSALAKDKVYEFVYVFAPLRLKGATGSPGNPFAIR